MPPNTRTSTDDPTTFNPPPDQTAALLDDLADPDITLLDVAHRHGTTLEALTLFLAREDIAHRVAALESTLALRIRLLTTGYLASVARALIRMVDEYTDESEHHAIRPGDLRATEQRRRSRETARRASALLLRLAKFTPGPSTPTRAPSPPRRHAEDEAPPSSPPSSSTSTANPRVSHPSRFAPHLNAHPAPEPMTQPAPPRTVHLPVLNNNITNAPLPASDPRADQRSAAITPANALTDINNAPASRAPPQPLAAA